MAFAFAFNSLRRAFVGSLTLVLLGCTTMRVIPPSVPTKDFVGSNDFVLLDDYAYRIGRTNTVLVVPKGFVTDYASIPPGVRMFLPKQSLYSRAAVIHDYLYWSQICTKDQADNLLMIAMKELRVPRWKRTAIYEAVSLAGGSAWASNRAERLADKPKVLPPDEFDLTNTMTWPQARQKLIAEHRVDPPFPLNPAACALGDSNVVP